MKHYILQKVDTEDLDTSLYLEDSIVVSAVGTRAYKTLDKVYNQEKDVRNTINKGYVAVNLNNRKDDWMWLDLCREEGDWPKISGRGMWLDEQSLFLEDDGERTIARYDDFYTIELNLRMQAKFL